ncbi:MAG: hypothetical protein Phog2KO_49450 [Phototrophicaceae bacterium]
MPALENISFVQNSFHCKGGANKRDESESCQEIYEVQKVFMLNTNNTCTLIDITLMKER